MGRHRGGVIIIPPHTPALRCIQGRCMKDPKSAKQLDDFVDYCFKHPELRFWQALRSWAKVNAIYVEIESDTDIKDTFYWDDIKSIHFVDK